MTTIIKDNGTWKADPSGLTSGDLDKWREGMYKACPNPEVGEIVIITNDKKDIMTGYRAQTSDGFNTRWQRVSSEVVREHLRMTEAPDNLGDYTYMCDGMYIHKDDAWW